MAFTGAVMWLSGRRSGVKIAGNAPAGKADTIILVGSETGSTWGFAAALHRGLRETGLSVHAAALSSFDPSRYLRAQRIIIMTATYGDGSAPASAKGFLDKLASLPHVPHVPVAVLGFGDRSFPRFCAFAQAICETAQAQGWHLLLPPGTVDRQSPQDFARWGRALGHALNLALDLQHQPALPQSVPLILISRRDYGADVQAPQAILRFAIPRRSLWMRLTGGGFGGFAAGDLLGIVPEGSSLPRFYSLASGHDDGFIEIAVKKHPGGLCSSLLTVLEPGQTVQGFIRPNPSFHVPAGDAPLILIGAGTGVGPLAGFIRSNTRHRPIHLFYGFRHGESDCLFDAEFETWQQRGHLDRMVTAASRGNRPHYVQDALRRDAKAVTDLIRSGARIMVCGGRGMAKGVSDALTDILLPFGLTPEMLRREGRYAEECY